MSAPAANGIAAFGVAYPRFMLADGTGVAAFDEDALTLAVAAARRIPAQAFDDVVLLGLGAGTVPVFVEALRLRGARVVEAAGAQAALVEARASPAERTLVVASGANERGAGAVALALGRAGAAFPMEPRAASGRALFGDANPAAAFLDLVAGLIDGKVGVTGAFPARPPHAVDRAVADAHRRANAASLGIAQVPMGAFVSPQEYARDAAARYGLVGKRCRACGRVAFPPRGSCVACAGTAFEDAPLSGRGTVYSATAIGKGGGPSEFALEQALLGAYVSGVVELEEGPRIAARLADVEAAPPIGTLLEATLRRIFEQQGVVRYGTKFAPR
ncbi:MAG: Zn-ribbon domain-containing OB-fold protein [Thermoplasmatota archaeon]